MIEVVPARELGQGGYRKVTEVFGDAFASDFAYLSKDTGVLADAFEHMLVFDLFYVAVVDGEPVAIAACTDGHQPSFRPQWKYMCRYFGLVKGTVGTIAFRSEFVRTVTGTTDAMASIEFVGTASGYQGRGAATALLTHLLALPQYREYLLEEISDINTPALNLYKKLGFVEYKRKPVWHTKYSGINHYVSMKLIQD